MDDYIEMLFWSDLVQIFNMWLEEYENDPSAFTKCSGEDYGAMCTKYVFDKYRELHP